MSKNNFLSTVKKPNVSTAGRLVSIGIGSALIYRALSGKKKPVQGILGGYLLFRGATGYCPASEVISKAASGNYPIKITAAITVNKPIEEAYGFWRNLSNLPLFMKHLASVTETGTHTSVWEAEIPGGLGTIEWEAEITAEKENELIEWRSVPDSDIDNQGAVYFKDGGKFGTELHITISYSAGAGNIAATLFNPLFEEMVRKDIKNFKRYIETGEIPTTEGQPSVS